MDEIYTNPASFTTEADIVDKIFFKLGMKKEKYIDMGLLLGTSVEVVENTTELLDVLKGNLPAELTLDLDRSVRTDFGIGYKEFFGYLEELKTTLMKTNDVIGAYSSPLVITKVTASQALMINHTNHLVNLIKAGTGYLVTHSGVSMFKKFGTKDIPLLKVAIKRRGLLLQDLEKLAETNSATTAIDKDVLKGTQSNFINPIWSVRRMLIDRDLKIAKSHREQVKLITLRIIELREGETVGTEKQIDKLKEEIASYERDIAKLEKV